MSHRTVRQLVEEVASRVGGVRSAIDATPLRTLHKEGKVLELIAAVKNILHLKMNLTLGRVNSGGRARAPAWIDLPRPMPVYGSAAFENQRVTVYIRKDFIATAPFATLTYVIAHEMAHVVLDGIGHPLRDNERAVDIAAMVLGFAEIAAEGASFEEIRLERQNCPRYIRWLQPLLEPFLINIVWEHSAVGYLSADEISEALRIIKKLRNN